MKTMALPLEPFELLEALRALQFKYFKWDIFHRGEISIAPDALVLSRAEHEQLVAGAEGVWAALRKVEAKARKDTAILEALAVPEALWETIAEQGDGHPRVTRCDFHRTPEGRWQISEFNDDVPSGFAECSGFAEVLLQRFGERFDGVCFEGELRQALTESFSSYDSIGFVHATGYSEDLQHVALVEHWLEEAGHETVIGSPANLSVRQGRAYLFDQPVDALFRYYPGEWIGKLPNALAWQEASRFLPAMNPLSALASQSKRFYACHTEHGIPLAKEEQAIIEEHIPASVYLERLTFEEVYNDRDWVLKGAFGRMGNTVRIGPLLSDEEWRKAVTEAFMTPRVIAAQKRFDTGAVWTSKGLAYPTVGLYLVDGRFAGYFSRIDKGPLIHYDSWHVPTLVEIS